MDDAVAVGTRHARVDLRDQFFRALGGGKGGIDRYTQGAEPIFIRWRYLEQGGIQFDYLTSEKQGYLAEEHRNKVGAAGLYSLAHIGPYKEVVSPEAALIPFFGVGSFTLGM